MRVVVAGLLMGALTVVMPSGIEKAAAQDAPASEAVAWAALASSRSVAPQPSDPAVTRVLREVVAYTSGWETQGRDISSLTTYLESLTDARRQLESWDAKLAPALAQRQGEVEGFSAQVDQLAAAEAETSAAREQAEARLAAQERVVGALARLLYTQPAPEWTAVEQLLQGDDLRAFDRQNLVSDVLEAKARELEGINAEVAALDEQLDGIRTELVSGREALAFASQRRDELSAARDVVAASLAALEADTGRAAAEVDAIRAAEAERLKAEVAAAAAAAAAEAAEAAANGVVGTARPTGGGAPAQLQGGDFSAHLPAAIPFREQFLTIGMQYRVEPGLLAAIASQESNFNPWSGCTGAGGGGKGILQHENQPQYCGPDAVGASIEKTAIMLAGYYNRSKSWTAAIFAYNNGPGLMDEWVQHSSDKGALLGLLAEFYNRQSYAAAGPYQGYPSWGDWRARVAYNYAAPIPDPGFRSATQKWLIYRQG